MDVSEFKGISVPPLEVPLDKQRETPKETLKRIYSKDQFKPIVVLFYTMLAATVWKCFSIPLPEVDIDFRLAFILGSYKIVSAFVLFAVIPMCIVKFVFHEKLADYGLRKGILLYTFRSSLVMIPALTVAAILTAGNPAFLQVYPFNRAFAAVPTNIGYLYIVFFSLHCVLYTGYYIGWEFLFRGFLQQGLSERCGTATAILVQTLASVMLHYGHPASEVFGAVLAGLFWGFLAVRTRSLYAGMIQHCWMGIVLDAVLIFRR
jgi:membrane protease YdiL (CAAX protease family)